MLRWLLCAAGLAILAAPAAPETLEYSMNWSFDMGRGRVLAKPAVWKDVVFVYGYLAGDAGGMIVALNATTGGLLWNHAFAEVHTEKRLKPPVVYDTADGSCLVFVVASGENLFAMNHSEPDLPLWQFSPSSSYTSRPAVGMYNDHANPVLHVTADVDENTTILYAFDAYVGPDKKFWEAKLGPEAAGVATAPTYLHVAEPNRVLIAVAYNGCVVAFDGNAGPTHPMVFGQRVRGKPVSREAPSIGYSEVSENVLFYTTVTDKGEYVGVAVDCFGGLWWEVNLDKLTQEDTMLTDPTASVDGTYVFYTEYSPTTGGMVVGLTATNGSVIWRVHDAYGAPNFSRPLATDQNTLMVLVQKFGELSVWNVDGNGRFINSFVVVGDCTYDDMTTDNPPYEMHLVGRTGFIPGIDHKIYSVTFPPDPAPYVPPPPPSQQQLLLFWRLLVAAVAVSCIALATAPRLIEWPPSSKRSRLDDTRCAEGLGPPPHPPGDDVSAAAESRYSAIRKLGAGMFGAVYLVRSKADGQYYALKRIPCNSEQELKEAMREWRILCEIQHHNKIAASESFVNWSLDKRQEDDAGILEENDGDGLPVSFRRYLCIVMQYHPEGDVRQYLRSLPRNTQLSEGTIFRYTAQISGLLAMLHAQCPPIIHRDLKPENLLLADNHRRLIVTDFGLAKIVDPGSYLQTHAGTFAYISPETWDRHYSTGADVWALGCIMYALLTKRVSSRDVRCFWRESADPEFQSLLVSEITQQYGCSEFFAATVARLLTPDRRRRPSARQVLEWAAPYAVPPNTPPSSPAHEPEHLAPSRLVLSRANGSTRGANQ